MFNIYKVYVYDPFYQGDMYINLIDNDFRFKLTESIEEASIVLSYGGDGTLLKTVSLLHECGNLCGTLVAGLNKGTVGFMANDMTETDFIKGVLSSTFSKQYIDERTLFDVNEGDFTQISLNEVSIHPRKRGKLFVCDISLTIPSMDIKDEHIVYKGDGVIISTASGSTAYNLSTGGPIITPCSGRITISPICPFSLADRSIVLPSDTEVTVTTETSSEVVVDGVSRYEPLGELTIKTYSEKLLLYKRDNFLKTIQEKLGWNHPIK